MFAGADHFAQPVSAAIDAGPHSSGGQLGLQGFGPGAHLIGHGQQADLLSRQPKGKIARIILGHDPEEPFQRAEDGAVDHDRSLAGAIGGHVFEVEAFGEIEVKLDGGALPQTANCVFDLQVDLGAVEGSAPLVNFVGPSLAIQRFDQSLGRQIPDGIFADRGLWAGG